MNGYSAAGNRPPPLHWRSAKHCAHKLTRKLRALLYTAPTISRSPQPLQKKTMWKHSHTHNVFLLCANGERHMCLNVRKCACKYIYTCMHMCATIYAHFVSEWQYTYLHVQSWVSEKHACTFAMSKAAGRISLVAIAWPVCFVSTTQQWPCTKR